MHHETNFSGVSPIISLNAIKTHNNNKKGLVLFWVDVGFVNTLSIKMLTKLKLLVI